MRQSPRPPLILHCHIPKTAGVTINDGLWRSFPDLHYRHSHPDRLHILSAECLEQLLRISPDLMSISSHKLRSFPLSVSGRPTFLFTFLRKPEDAFISLLRYGQRQFSRLSPERRRSWPKDTPQLPLRELARQYLQLVATNQDFCPQTRFFCNRKAMARFGITDSNDYGVDSYEIAQSILSEFHFVGIVDEMKKSLEVLTDLLIQRGVQVHFQASTRKNSAPERRRPAWLTLGDEIGRRVIEASRSDQLLYQHFRRQLLASHQELRKRSWLGFRPAAQDACKALISSGLPGTLRSIAHSGQLLSGWRKTGANLGSASDLELSHDLLEERAVRNFIERTRNPVAASNW